MTPAEFAAALGNQSFIDRERADARAESRALRLLYAAHSHYVPTAPRKRWWLEPEPEGDTP